MNKVEATLTKARNLIAKRGKWAKGSMYADGSFCAVGGLRAASSGESQHRLGANDEYALQGDPRALKLLAKVMYRQLAERLDDPARFEAMDHLKEGRSVNLEAVVIIVNDNDKTKKKDVLKAFDTAINYARRRHYNAD